MHSISTGVSVSADFFCSSGYAIHYIYNKVLRHTTRVSRENSGVFPEQSFTSVFDRRAKQHHDDGQEHCVLSRSEPENENVASSTQAQALECV